MKQYYWSNDDTPFQTIMMPEELTENKYPIVVEAPDPSLKSPKYDWTKNQWIENDAQSQGERLNSVENKVDDLSKSIKTTQIASQATAQQNSMITKQLGANQQMLMALQKTLAGVAHSVEGLTNKDNDGGNN